jgi:hypothetical protein
VTDQSVTILYCGMFRKMRPRSVYARLSRNTRIGPVDTNLDPVFSLYGIGYHVDDQYVSMIRAADAELATGDAMPPDPS